MSLMTKRGKKTQLARTGLTFLLLLTIFVHVKFEVQPESTYSTVENDELARIPVCDNPIAKLRNRPANQRKGKMRLQDTRLGDFRMVQKVYEFEDLWLTNSTAKHFRNRHDDSFSLETNPNRGKKSELINSSDFNHIVETFRNFPNIAQKSLKCRKCVVVGSGGCLKGRNLGSLIDSHEVVFRMNDAPLRKYQKDVGLKTDVRVLYPESAPYQGSQSKRLYRGLGFVVVLPFKWSDLYWATMMVDRSKFKSFSALRFWRSVSTVLPVRTHRIGIISPELIYSLNGEFMENNNSKATRPTTGTIAIYLALQMCESVSIAGFCYDARANNGSKYFGRANYTLFVDPFFHNVELENNLRRKFIELNLVDDLTKH